jgi:hypothetical protein
LRIAVKGRFYPCLSKAPFLCRSYPLIALPLTRGFRNSSSMIDVGSMVAAQQSFGLSISSCAFGIDFTIAFTSLDVELQFPLRQ